MTVAPLFEPFRDGDIAGTATREDPLYQKIEVLVDHIRADFDTDIGIFASAMTAFEQFLGEREAAGSELIEQTAHALHEREKREMARLIAIDEIERRITANELPAAVVAMLRGPWTRVFERVYLRDGGRNQHFSEALEAVDDLTWSVAPKMDSDGRKRLVLMLPSLLKRLQVGLEIAAVEQRGRERFFSALVDCHAAAVKASLRGESVAALLASTQPTAEAAPLFEKLINEERAREAALKKATDCGIARIRFSKQGIEFREVLTPVAGDATTATSTAARVDDTFSKEKVIGSTVDFDITGARTVELMRGTWIEFIHGKSIKLRAKLTWISPLKGMYLFTSPGVNEALSVAPDALQAQLKCGKARIIEESSMIDRAVNRIFNSLSTANP